jgi:Asp-tRNA(Asn)/Glu-tRNA(Gln) amidotransferase A subunit family amidase
MTESCRRLAGLVRTGITTATATCEDALERARASAQLGAFWYVASVEARAAAKAVDAAVQRGRDPGRLAGVPVGVKDAFDVAGMPGGGGGPVRIAGQDAFAVQRLRSEGAVVLGKLAMHQLGWGMSGQTPGRPLCKNPYAPGRQPGGSSSGCAAAVAAETVPLALGADSGGSVRVPAAWCGVAGYKPARATVPRTGLLPLADIFDTVGLVARSIDDCLLADAVLRGAPEQELTPVSSLTLGVARRLVDQAQPEVTAQCTRALEALADLGVRLVDVEPPVRGIPLRPIYAAELASVWADEVEANPPSYGADVRNGVATGLGVSAVDYLRALREVDRARREARLAVDALACPASQILPPALEAPDDVAAAGRCARVFNLLDWPSLVVPCGSMEAPVGLQFAGPPGREGVLFALAVALEEALAVPA